MKDLLIRFLLGLFVFLLIYLVGVFIQLSFNISNWSLEARSFVGLLGVFFGVMVSTLPNSKF